MFQIIIDKTGKLNIKDVEDHSAIGAIETIYNFPEDKVTFKFGDYDFVAFLSGDISDSWRDIIQLREDIKSDLQEINIQFPSQSFWHYWEFKEVGNSNWEIQAHWGDNNTKKIVVSKDVFQLELQKLIELVESDLEKQGYDLFAFLEYIGVRKNSSDKILAWRKYPIPNGSNYYRHSLEKEFNVRVLFDFCQILEAQIFAEGWKFLVSKFGLRGLFEIDKESGWFDGESKSTWLESILYHALLTGINIQSGSLGIYKENSNIFETKDGRKEKINWEAFKTQKI